MKLVVPTQVATGAPALLEVSTRESKSTRSTVNVRLSLPKGKLRAEDGERAVESSGGGSVVQFPVVMN